MSNYPNVAAEASDKYLAMLEQSQDQFVEFVRSSREMMPKMPEGFTAAPKAMPFAMPSARAIADAQLDFATKLLKQQEGFVRSFYKQSSKSTTNTKRAAGAATKDTKSKTRSTARRTPRTSKASS